MTSQPISVELGESDLAHILAAGLEVIETEARALAELSGLLDENFSEAVRLILSNRQRVIVGGMGKSGHIGRKIAATLASTGTPALFVHPAEAAHGDLGMITSGDTLLLLSNSGATPELRAMIDHARALGCKIIAVASRVTSPLMRAADVRITLPAVPEACPVNIAPTSSTTMMLALGDALAVAAMRLRGLTRERLQLLHPGGTIGGRLLPVDQMMHGRDALPLVQRATPMADVIVEITRRSYGIAGVVEGECLVGVITDGDLRRHSDNLMALTAADVMTGEPKCVPEGTRAEDALRLLQEHKITALFVMAHDAPERPVGLVHVHDFARLRDGA